MTSEFSQTRDREIDAQALRRKYREERDKRLSERRVAPYVAPTGELERYLEDPHATDMSERPSIAEDVTVCVIGAGFGGIQAAVALQNAGIESLRIIDKAGDFGGVWYWNRYPGASCDIESYVYMPLLDETGYIPTQRYARGPEILAYARSIATQFALYEKALLNTGVAELRWDEAGEFWHVRTDRGDALRARFVMMATGVLQSVRLPRIKGIESFAGHSFHTARWDYAYTGGSPETPLTGLANKRVGIIGTGATAVQCIPHLAKSAEQLFVFQRTPAAVPVRDNKPTNLDWARSLQPGWQMERIENFNNLICGLKVDRDLVNDGWTEVLGRIGVDLQGVNDQDESRQARDFAFMESVRARVDEVVKDKGTAEALKPWFDIMCKRPCFHDEYLDVFNRPNVKLVDTGGLGVDRIDGKRIFAGNKAYELDSLIFASGFDFQGADLASRNRFEIYGRHGLSLTEKWGRGMKTLFGHFNHGFPNLFNQTATQAGLTSNVTHGLGEAGRHFATIVKHCLDQGITSFEPTRGAEDAWVERLRSLAGARSNYDRECTPGYYNNEGRPEEFSGLDSFYPEGAAAFIALMRAWLADGRFEGMILNRERKQQRAEGGMAC